MIIKAQLYLFTQLRENLYYNELIIASVMNNMYLALRK